MSLEHLRNPSCINNFEINQVSMDQTIYYDKTCNIKNVLIGWNIIHEILDNIL